jgi:predicted nucleotidyltransferase
MGKLFSPGEIRNGLVPTTADFFSAKSYILDGLESLVQEGSVIGATVFGSIAKGTPSVRSDFDLLVITESEAVTPHLKDLCDFVDEKTHIGVDPIHIPRDLAAQGLHTIDRSFTTHLRDVPTTGNTVGIPPLELLKPHPMPLPQVHSQYLIQKLRKLRRGLYSGSEEDRLRVMQRALEAPINTGRRTLQVLSYLGAGGYSPQDDGKQSVIRDFRSMFGDSALLNGFNDLVHRDSLYTLTLSEALSGKISLDEYAGELHRLSQEVIPLAISWVSDVTNMYHDFEGAPSSLEGTYPTFFRPKE